MDALELQIQQPDLNDLPPSLQQTVKVMVNVLSAQVVAPMIKAAEERFERRVEESTQWHQSQFKNADTHLDHALAQMKEAKRGLEKTAQSVNDSMLGANSRLGSLEAGHSSHERDIRQIFNTLDSHSAWLRNLDTQQALNHKSISEVRGDLYGSPDAPGRKSIMSRFDDFEKKFDERLDLLDKKLNDHELYITNRKRMEAVLFTGWMHIWKNKLVILWVLSIIALLVFSIFGVQKLTP